MKKIAFKQRSLLQVHTYIKPCNKVVTLYTQIFIIITLLLTPINSIANAQHEVDKGIESYSIKKDTRSRDENISVLKKLLLNSDSKLGKHSKHSQYISLELAMIYQESENFEAASIVIRTPNKLYRESEDHIVDMLVTIRAVLIFTITGKYEKANEELMKIGVAYNLHETILENVKEINNVKSPKWILKLVLSESHKVVRNFDRLAIGQPKLLRYKLSEYDFVEYYFRELLNKVVRRENKQHLYDAYIFLLERLDPTNVMAISDAASKAAKVYSIRYNATDHEKKTGIYYLKKSANLRIEHNLNEAAASVVQLSIAYIQINDVEASNRTISFLIELLGNTQKKDEHIKVGEGLVIIQSYLMDNRRYDESREIYGTLIDYISHHADSSSDQLNLDFFILKLASAFEVGDDIKGTDIESLKQKFLITQVKADHFRNVRKILTFSEKVWEKGNFNLSLKILKVIQSDLVKWFLVVGSKYDVDSDYYSKWDDVIRLYKGVLKIGTLSELNDSYKNISLHSSNVRRIGRKVGDLLEQVAETTDLMRALNNGERIAILSDHHQNMAEYFNDFEPLSVSDKGHRKDSVLKTALCSHDYIKSLGIAYEISADISGASLEDLEDYGTSQAYQSIQYLIMILEYKNGDQQNSKERLSSSINKWSDEGHQYISNLGLDALVYYDFIENNYVGALEKIGRIEKRKNEEYDQANQLNYYLGSLEVEKFEIKLAKVFMLLLAKKNNLAKRDADIIYQKLIGRLEEHNNKKKQGVFDVDVAINFTSGYLAFVLVEIFILLGEWDKAISLLKFNIDIQTIPDISYFTPGLLTRNEDMLHEGEFTWLWKKMLSGYYDENHRLKKISLKQYVKAASHQAMVLNNNIDSESRLLLISAINYLHANPIQQLSREARNRANKTIRLRNLYREREKLRNELQNNKSKKESSSFTLDDRFNYLLELRAYKEWNCAEVFREETGIERKIFKLKNEIKTSKLRDKIFILNDEISGIETSEINKIVSKGRSFDSISMQYGDLENFPRYNLFQGNDHAMFDLIRLRRALAPNQAIFSYTIFENSTVLYLLTNIEDTDRSIIIPKGREYFSSKVAGVRAGFTNLGKQGALNYQSSEYWEWVNLLKELYNDLIAVAQDSTAQYDDLVIFPDGPLRSLPFGFLVKEILYEESWGEKLPVDQIWLIDSISTSIIFDLESLISESFSAVKFKEKNISYFEEPKPQFVKSKSHHYAFLGMGDPKFINNTENDKCSLAERGALEVLRSVSGGVNLSEQQADNLNLLCSLPGSKNEITAVASLFPSSDVTLYYSDTLLETNLKELNDDIGEDGFSELSRYKYVLFATHALMSQESGKFSEIYEPALVLTPTPGSIIPTNEGLLTMSEIMKLDFDADVVTLSACNTASGSGADTQNYGLSGLAKAFAYAGAKNVLASHWAVSDDSTAVLMKEYFRLISSSPIKSHARFLQQAKKTVKSIPEYAHPYYWAPFDLLRVSE